MNPRTELVLLHGTTLRRAMQIEADFSFRRAPGESLWVVFRSNRDIAEHFAYRKAQRENDRPAIVSATVDDLVFQALRKSQDALYIPFDEEDDPFLRARRQWKISPAGVARLNAAWDDIAYEELGRQATS